MSCSTISDYCSHLSCLVDLTHNPYFLNPQPLSVLNPHSCTLQDTDSLYLVMDYKPGMHRCNPSLLNPHPRIFHPRPLQDTDSLYLVMDYVPGGEFFTHMRDHGRLREEHARFYVAQIVLALDHLHSKGIVYRDLKVCGGACVLALCAVC